MITKEKKESIIAEKLRSGISYRELGRKYKLRFQTIHRWVEAFQGKMRNRKNEKKVKPKVQTAEVQLPTEVKILQEELRKSRLLNEILTEVINVAEEELKIPIRKKFGAK